MTKDPNKRIWTIPNILTFIRLLCVPVYMGFIIGAKDFSSGIVNDTFVYIGFGILVGAASTDLFDGYIARHFNQVSDLGKVLDPIADKVMCVTALLSLTIIGYMHWGITLALAIKEISQMAFAAYGLKQKIIIPSRIYGKVAMWFLSIGIILSFFHPVMAEKVFYLDWIVEGIGVLIGCFAFFMYFRVYLSIKKDQSTEAKDQETQETKETTQENKENKEI